VQAAEGLLDQRDAEPRHAGEVAVEGGRGDAHLAGHLAQPDAAQALLLEQSQRRVEQRLTGALLPGLPDSARRRLGVLPARGVRRRLVRSGRVRHGACIHGVVTHLTQ